MSQLTESCVLWKILWLFGVLPTYNGDYIDLWMIKIMIKTNQIDINVCFFTVDDIK